MIDRRAFLSSTGVLLLATAIPSLTFAQAPLSGRLVFGVPRGSIGNNLAEGALAILATQFNTRYHVDVVDGRNTLQASETVKLAPADGTTLLQAQSSSMVLFPSMYKSLAFDPIKDFIPLAMLGNYSYTLSVGPAVPARVTNIETYLAWVRENPDFRDVGFSLYGSQGHLLAMMLARGMEIALRPQSYKSAPAIFNDMQSQALAAAITVSGNLEVLAHSGVRPLAVTGDNRIASWPNVMTFKEQGLKDTQIEGWYGWFAPANTPPPLVQALRDAINGMIATTQFAELQKKLLITPQSMTPAQISTRMRDEIASYKKLVDSYGLSQIV